MTLNQMLGHLQLVAHTAYLIFKQPLQRFAQFQLHILWQASYVMMALDGHSRYTEALYAVRVDGSLSQPSGVGYFTGLGIKHFYEVSAYYFALLFGVGYAL